MRPIERVRAEVVSDIDDRSPDPAESPTAEQVRALDGRLERIEAALAGSPRGDQTSSNADAATAEQLRQLDRRLERIEAAVTSPP